MNKIWLHNKLVPESQAKVPVLDRGFLYGDGIYEAVRIYEGKIFRAEKHWKRMAASLRSVHIKIPWSHPYLTKACLATAEANGMAEALVRVTVSRGVGHLGYDPSSCKNPTLAVIAAPVREDLPALWKTGVKVAIVKVRRNHVRSLSPAIKHTNALNGILAKMESLKKAAFEGVFLNLDGYVAEGTISNLFIVKNNILKTPALDCGILDGVTRRAILELAKKSKIKVLETYLRINEVRHADEVFLSSTTMEVMPVVRVDSKKIGKGIPGPISNLLHQNFRSLLRKELGIHA